MMSDEVRKGMAYFSLATVCVLYSVLVSRNPEGLYAVCDAIVLTVGLLLYLAAAVMFFPTGSDNDDR